jgi:hypothetical protein
MLHIQEQYRMEAQHIIMSLVLMYLFLYVLYLFIRITTNEYIRVTVQAQYGPIGRHSMSGILASTTLGPGGQGITPRQGQTPSARRNIQSFFMSESIRQDILKRNSMILATLDPDGFVVLVLFCFKYGFIDHHYR